MKTARTGVNLELAASSEILALACELKPMQATLVPEKREEVTTEGGLDLGSEGNLTALAEAVSYLKAVGIRTALFIDPDPESLRLSKEETLYSRWGDYFPRICALASLVLVLQAVVRRSGSATYRF